MRKKLNQFQKLLMILVVGAIIEESSQHGFSKLIHKAHKLGKKIKTRSKNIAHKVKRKVYHLKNDGKIAKAQMEKVKSLESEIQKDREQLRKDHEEYKKLVAKLEKQAKQLLEEKRKEKAAEAKAQKSLNLLDKVKKEEKAAERKAATASKEAQATKNHYQDALKTITDLKKKAESEKKSQSAIAEMIHQMLKKELKDLDNQESESTEDHQRTAQLVGLDKSKTMLYIPKSAQDEMRKQMAVALLRRKRKQFDAIYQKPTAQDLDKYSPFENLILCVRTFTEHFQRLRAEIYGDVDFKRLDFAGDPHCSRLKVTAGFNKDGCFMSLMSSYESLSTLIKSYLSIQAVGHFKELSKGIESKLLEIKDLVPRKCIRKDGLIIGGSLKQKKCSEMFNSFFSRFVHPTPSEKLQDSFEQYLTLTEKMNTLFIEAPWMDFHSNCNM